MSRQLLIRGGAIGDFVLTLPIMEGLRGCEPEVEIHILGYPHIAELAVGRRHASAARRVDAPEWAPLFSRDSSLAAAELEYLRGFDRVICVWPDGDGTMREKLHAAGVRQVLLVKPMPPAGSAMHAVEFVAGQCERAGLPLKWLEPHLYPSERDRWWCERFLRVTGAGAAPLLGVAPGSGSASKNWPAEGYAALIRHWVKRQGGALLFAGPADEKPMAALRALLKDVELLVVQEEALPRVAALLERCEAFVGNDSGLTHIAAAVRTPTVAIFGPTDPAVWRPLAPRVKTLAPPAGGSIADITAAEVIEQVRLLTQG